LAKCEENAMSKYMLVYQGQIEGPMPELSKEESDAMMQRWTDWMGKVGPALADGGAPPATALESEVRADPSQSLGTTSSTPTTSTPPKPCARATRSLLAHRPTPLTCTS
jgi:hypothetical protein